MSDDFLMPDLPILPDLPEKDVELTDEQWTKVLNEWNSRPKNPPSLTELTQIAAGKPGLDGRSALGREIRKRLAENNMKVIKAGEYQAKGLLELSSLDKEFIENNCGTMSSLELARELYKNPKLSNLNQETKTIAGYLKDSGLKTYSDPSDVPQGEYRAPTTFDRTLQKINRHRHEQIAKEKITGKQKKDIFALLNYLNIYRFKRQINTYEQETDRELFESTFVRYTYDKHDLTEEEVDQYIVLATEVVIAATIQARIEIFRKKLDEAVNNDEKVYMTLVETINTSQTEYHQSIQRQEKLVNALKIKRSEKEGQGKNAAMNLHNLVELWKEETTRKEMIDEAKKRGQDLRQEVDRLTKMEEIKCRLLGLDPEEIVNG